MVVVYHYTDEAGLDAIYRSNQITAFKGAYGVGVYFTELNPMTTPKQQIAQNNWGTTDLTKTRFWYKFKTEHYPAIKQVKNIGRNIWLHPGDLKLHENSGVKIYHYTDQQGKDGIVSSGFIRPHQPKDVTKKDGTVQVLPKGVYFTEHQPKSPQDRKKCMLKAFGSSARDESLYRKTRYWFWFRVGALPGVRKQRAAHGGFEWVLERDADIKLGRS